MKRTTKRTVSAGAVVVVWFLAVDWSWFVYDCPDCGYGRDIFQYRLFTVPVHETVRECSSVIQPVAADPGTPCQHLNAEVWHKHRWWGLCICAAPCINGTYRLTTDDSWYDAEASAKVTALAAEDSSVADRR